MATLATRLRDIDQRIRAACERAGRRRDEVRLVAVTKTFGPECIVAGYQAGVRHFGENRVQEFAAKRPSLDLPEAVFHLVGHLQTNKARKAVELFDRVDTVDDVRLAERLGRSASESNRSIPILLQVRLGGESSKSGIEPDDVPALAKNVASLPGVRLEGLMTIPPYFDVAGDARPYFKGLCELSSALAADGAFACEEPVLSMGMSHDFEIAIEEGATEIRIGTALFGERE